MPLEASGGRVPESNKESLSGGEKKSERLEAKQRALEERARALKEQEKEERKKEQAEAVEKALKKAGFSAENIQRLQALNVKIEGTPAYVTLNSGNEDWKLTLEQNGKEDDFVDSDGHWQIGFAQDSRLVAFNEGTDGLQLTFQDFDGSTRIYHIRPVDRRALNEQKKDYLLKTLNIHDWAVPIEAAGIRMSYYAHGFIKLTYPSGTDFKYYSNGKDAKPQDFGSFISVQNLPAGPAVVLSPGNERIGYMQLDSFNSDGVSNTLHFVYSHPDGTQENGSIVAFAPEPLQ